MGRHRAAFHDLLLLVGRVNAYRQRLEDLKGQRMKLDQEKRQCNDVLGYLHREIFTCEVHLKQVEKDLIGASKVMQVKRVSDQQFGNALEVLRAAKIDKKEKEDTAKFELAKKDAVKRKRREAYAEAQRMEIAARTWSGEGTKPVPLTAYQKAKYFASRMRKLRREFVLEAARVSEADARSAIDAKNAAL